MNSVRNSRSTNACLLDSIHPSHERDEWKKMTRSAWSFASQGHGIDLWRSWPSAGETGATLPWLLAVCVLHMWRGQARGIAMCDLHCRRGCQPPSLLATHRLCLLCLQAQTADAVSPLWGPAVSCLIFSPYWIDSLGPIQWGKPSPAARFGPLAIWAAFCYIARWSLLSYSLPIDFS